MAAQLLQIKSRLMLPRPPAEDEEEDPREELVLGEDADRLAAVLALAEAFPLASVNTGAKVWLGERLADSEDAAGKVEPDGAVAVIE